MNLCVQILSIVNTRPEIYHNIQRIRGIHERFLAQLQTTTPSSATNPDEPGFSEMISRSVSKRLGDIPVLKNRSLRTRKFKASVNKALAAEPLEALEVAREIDKLVGITYTGYLRRYLLCLDVQSMSFSAYEEFCSNYELLTQDVAILRRSIPNWTVFDQGIEALSKSVTSMKSRKREENRSMSLNDLLIKVRRQPSRTLLPLTVMKTSPSSASASTRSCCKIC